MSGTKRTTRFTRAMRPLFLEPKSWGGEYEERDGVADRGFTEEGDAAVVDISGPLLNRAEGFWSLFFDDYVSIRARVAAALETPCRRVILRINSPGGDAHGCFELSRELRAMARAAGKTLLAYADGMAASAAYAIACAADEIHVPPAACVGSIGVLQPMCDVTQMNQAMGLNVVIVSSGKAKTDGHPDVAISEEAVTRVQAQIDGLAALFFDLVAEMRGVDAEAVRGLDGALFYGDRAISARLGDRVSVWADLIAGTAGLEEDAMPQASKSYDEAISTLRKCAEKDDDEGKKAKRMLKAELDEDPDKDAKKAEEPEKKDEAKAEDKDGEKKDEAKALVARAEAAAEAAAKRVLAEAAKASADKVEIARLLGTRSDFDPKMRASLSTMTVEQVKDAVETWPRRTAALAPAAASQVMPSVQGERQGELEMPVDAESQAFLDKKMGKEPKTLTTPIVIGSGDRAAAKARVAELDGGK